MHYDATHIPTGHRIIGSGETEMDAIVATKCSIAHDDDVAVSLSDRICLVNYLSLINHEQNLCENKGETFSIYEMTTDRWHVEKHLKPLTQLKPK